MGKQLDKPTLEQHVKIGQAKKDYKNALSRFMNLTCTVKAPGCFLYAKEQDKLCNLANVGPVDMICSRLEDVMFADFPWLSNDAFGVYYHEDEKMTLYKLYKAAGKKYEVKDGELPEIKTLAEILEERKPPTVDDVFKIAERNDKWVDHFTDRIIDECEYSGSEDYWIEHLMHSHREIAEMMRDAVMREIEQQKDGEQECQ